MPKDAALAGQGHSSTADEGLKLEADVMPVITVDHDGVLKDIKCGPAQRYGEAIHTTRILLSAQIY